MSAIVPLPVVPEDKMNELNKLQVESIQLVNSLKNKAFDVNKWLEPINQLCTPLPSNCYLLSSVVNYRIDKHREIHREIKAVQVDWFTGHSTLQESLAEQEKAIAKGGTGFGKMQKHCSEDDINESYKKLNEWVQRAQEAGVDIQEYIEKFEAAKELKEDFQVPESSSSPEYDLMISRLSYIHHINLYTNKIIQKVFPKLIEIQMKDLSYRLIFVQQFIALLFEGTESSEKASTFRNSLRSLVGALSMIHDINEISDFALEQFKSRYSGFLSPVVVEKRYMALFGLGEDKLHSFELSKICLEKWKDLAKENNVDISELEEGLGDLKAIAFKDPSNVSNTIENLAHIHFFNYYANRIIHKVTEQIINSKAEELKERPELKEKIWLIEGERKWLLSHKLPKLGPAPQSSAEIEQAYLDTLALGEIKIQRVHDYKWPRK